MRRHTLAAPLLLSLLATQIGCGDSPGENAAVAERPLPSPVRLAESAPADSVILITIDTLRADSVGFAGNERVETPVMDRLAATGRVFSEAHAHSVMTLPSHTNILTGLLPYHHGVRDNGGFVLAEEVPTLAAMLRERGFATAAIVSAFPLDARFGLDRGFDLYDDAIPGSGADPFAVTERTGGQAVERALAWWREHAAERRFLWVHLFEPHAPYEPPPPFSARYPQQPYLGEVAAVDAFLEPLLGPLLAAGPAAGPLVVLTSDHGEGLGDHGEATHGIFAYESTLRIPLVLWGPGIPPGRDERPARHVDIVPTVLQAAGVGVEPTAEAALDGVSLFAAAEPETGRETYFEALTGNLNRGWAPLRGIIRHDRKSIELPLPELYDLFTDPDETTNLATGADARTAGLPEESVWPPEKGEVPPEVESRLRALGYLGGSGASQKTWGPADDPKNLIHLDRELIRTHELFGRGRFEEAAAAAEAIIRERPTLSIAHEYLALSYLRLGRTEEAVTAMRRAQKGGVARAALLHQLALTLTRTGRADQALPFLEQMLERGGADRVGTLNALGPALLGAGRPEEAIAALEQVFESDPNNAMAWENLAMVYQATGQWNDSREAALEAVELDANRPDAWNNLGVALAYLGETDGAFAAWDRALALAPGHVDALFNMGLVAGGAGDDERMRRAFDRFLEVAPAASYASEIEVAREALAGLSN